MQRPRNALKFKIEIIKGKGKVKHFTNSESANAGLRLRTSSGLRPRSGDLFRCLRQVAFAEATSGNVIPHQN